jgi:hypothetical protein
MTKSNNFAGLTNEELVVIHARFKDHLDNMDKMLKEQAFMKNVNLSKNEGAVIKVPLDKGDVAKIQESEYYLITKRVVDKLSTVVEIIQETTDIKVPHLNNL